jgi:hypothetical protein
VAAEVDNNWICGLIISPATPHVWFRLLETEILWRNIERVRQLRTIPRVQREPLLDLLFIIFIRAPPSQCLLRFLFRL